MVFEIAICIFGFFLNGLVILTVLKNVFQLSAASFFVLSIAISDFLSCAVAVPFAIVYHFKKSWPFGMAGCEAHAFMIFLFALVSITHMAAISVGKYLTITKSLSSDSYFDNKQVLLIIACLWLYSFGVSAPPLFGWSSYGLEGINATCSIQWNSSSEVDKTYLGLVFFACYLIPIAIITFCYHEIHRVAKQVVASMQVSSLSMTMNQAILQKQHRSAMYFLVIVVSFLVCWTPYAIVSFILVLGKKINPLATSAPSVFAKMSFLVNPVLYALFSRKFRRRLLITVPTSKRNRAVAPSTILAL